MVKLEVAQHRSTVELPLVPFWRNFKVISGGLNI